MFFANNDRIGCYILLRLATSGFLLRTDYSVSGEHPLTRVSLKSPLSVARKGESQ